MRIAKNDIPVKIKTDGAVARQKTDFGNASGYEEIGAEYFSIASGTDLSPLLQGLHNDLCHAPHWGYLIEGKLTVRYKDGSEEKVNTGDLFYLPPNHTVRADQDTEVVLFSPQREHTPVLDHINRKLSG